MIQQLKKIMLSVLGALVTLWIIFSFLQGCTDKCEVSHVYSLYEPQYVTYQEIPSSVKLTDARPLENPGKIYIKGDYLYINEKGEGIHIVDISNIEQPKLYKSYDLQSPHGLGIDGNQLFICEGENGLKSFKVNAPETAPNLQLKAHHAYFHAYDLIPFKNTLITIGDDGLYQFDYGNEKNLTLLSKIPVNKNDDNNENIVN